MSLATTLANMPLEPGRKAAVTLHVSTADTAVALGSGSVEVLATPRAVALVEQASCAAVDPALGHDVTSVGTRVDLDHLRATPVGMTVTAEAELTEVQGRRLTFAVSVRDDRGVVASGVVHRVLVDRDRFARC
jgi:predicted thioesterase